MPTGPERRNFSSPDFLSELTATSEISRIIPKLNAGPQLELVAQEVLAHKQLLSDKKFREKEWEERLGWVSHVQENFGVSLNEGDSVQAIMHDQNERTLLEVGFVQTNLGLEVFQLSIFDHTQVGISEYRIDAQSGNLVYELFLIDQLQAALPSDHRYHLARVRMPYMGISMGSFEDGENFVAHDSFLTDVGVVSLFDITNHGHDTQDQVETVRKNFVHVEDGIWAPQEFDRQFFQGKTLSRRTRSLYPLDTLVDLDINGIATIYKGVSADQMESLELVSNEEVPDELEQILTAEKPFALPVYISNQDNDGRSEFAVDVILGNSWRSIDTLTMGQSQAIQMVTHIPGRPIAIGEVSRGYKSGWLVVSTDNYGVPIYFKVFSEQTMQSVAESRWLRSHQN